MSLLSLNKRRRIVGGGGVVDPYASSVVLHLKGDVSPIVDSSPSNHTINLVGSPIISTAQSKYGGSSLYFNGSSHVWSTLEDINGDFTIEAWLYWVSSQHTTEKGAWQVSSTSGGLSPYYSHSINALSSAQRYYALRGTTILSSNNFYTINQWQHLTHCRQGNNYYCSLNGIVQSLGTSTSLLSSSFVSIGGYYSTDFSGNLYIDSFRITKGIARYTSNFNPETDTYLAY
jgi:hypothetical protein